jgi:hypothetical protein
MALLKFENFVIANANSTFFNFYRNNRIGYLGAQRLCPGIAKNVSLETLKVGLYFVVFNI